MVVDVGYMTHQGGCCCTLTGITSLRGQPTALGQWLLGAAVSDSVGRSHGHDDVILLLL